MKHLPLGLALVFACMTPSKLSAQLLSYGVDVGAHFANVSMQTPSSLDPNDVTFVANGGMHVGPYARRGMGIAYVQAPLWLTQIDQSIIINQSGNSMMPMVTVPWTMRRLDVPVEVGVKLGPFFGFVAPVWSAGLQDISDVSNLTENDGTWGAQIGAGIKLSKFQAKLRYEGNLSPFAQALNYQGQVIATDGRMSQIIASLSYRL